MEWELIRSLLGWCAVINYSILILWFLMFCLGRKSIYNMHRRWFNLTEAQFEVINYGGIGLFKLLIFVFNVTPYLVLRCTF